MRREVKPDLKKPAPSSKKLGEQKMPKKLAMIPSIKPPAPICKEDTVPKVGKNCSLCINLMEEKFRIMLEILFSHYNVQLDQLNLISFIYILIHFLMLCSLFDGCNIF